MTDPRKECPLCVELGKPGVVPALSHAWYNSIAMCDPVPPPEGMTPEFAEAWASDQETRPKVLGMKAKDYEALAEEEKAGYYRAESWGCGRTDLGMRECVTIKVRGEKVVTEPGMTREIHFHHKWNVWDEDGEVKWSRSTCVHGARWTSVLPCRECGSVDVMLSPYDQSLSKDEIRKLARAELDQRIGNVRAGYEAGKKSKEAEE